MRLRKTSGDADTNVHQVCARFGMGAANGTVQVAAKQAGSKGWERGALNVMEGSLHTGSARQ